MFVPTSFGKYELLAPLPGDDIVVVFKAALRGGGDVERPVLLKQIRPHAACTAAFVEALIAEMKLAVSLAHGNIIPVYEMGRTREIYFVSYQFVDGMSLATLLALARRLWLSVDHAVLIAIELCRGLAYAHALRARTGAALIHGDLRPSRIIVTEKGGVRIADFGLARLTRQRLCGAQPGGAAQMPAELLASLTPEDLSGGTVGPARDIFSVGLILYELLTSRHAFLKRRQEDTLAALGKGQLSAPSTYNQRVPAALAQIVVKALARKPEDRFASANALAAALARFLLDIGSTASVSTFATYVRQLAALREQTHSADPALQGAPTETTGSAVPVAPDTDEMTHSYAIHREIAVAHEDAGQGALPDALAAVQGAFADGGTSGDLDVAQRDPDELLEPIDELAESEFAAGLAEADTAVEGGPVSARQTLVTREPVTSPPPLPPGIKKRRVSTSVSGTMRLLLHGKGASAEENAVVDGAGAQAPDLLATPQARSPRRIWEMNPTLWGWIVVTVALMVLVVSAYALWPAREPRGPQGMALKLEDIALPDIKPPRAVADIELSAVPAGAAFLLHVGDTPVTLERLDQGQTHVVRLEREGYRIRHRTITPDDFEGGTATIRVGLEPVVGNLDVPTAPPLPGGEASGRQGRAIIASDPPSASVWLVLGAGTVRLREREARFHYFMALHEGYHPQVINVSAADFSPDSAEIRRLVKLSPIKRPKP